MRHTNGRVRRSIGDSAPRPKRRRKLIHFPELGVTLSVVSARRIHHMDSMKSEHGFIFDFWIWNKDHSDTKIVRGHTEKMTKQELAKLHLRIVRRIELFLADRK